MAGYPIRPCATRYNTMHIFVRLRCLRIVDDHGAIPWDKIWIALRLNARKVVHVLIVDLCRRERGETL